jgi:hypothetical protein
MIKIVKKPFSVFLIIFSLLFIFNNSNNSISEKNLNTNFDPNSTVIVPNYKQLFLRNYESKYKLIYSKDNTIEKQSK